jgi:hypothetical protein
MVVAGVGTMAGGGVQQGSVGPGGVMRVTTSGLLVFLVCAAILHYGTVVTKIKSG